MVLEVVTSKPLPGLYTNTRLVTLCSLYSAHTLRPSDVQEHLAPALAAWQVGDVGVARERLSDVPAGLNLSDLDEAITGLADGLADGVCALCLTLGADNVGLALLLGLLDDEAGALGVLLGNLLLLDGLGELLAESHVRDGDVLEGNVELGGAAGEVGTNTLRDGLALGDELGGVKLGNYGLEDLVADGGQNTLVVVDAEVLG